MERQVVVDLGRLARNDERGGLGPRRVANGRIRIREVHEQIQGGLDRLSLRPPDSEDVLGPVLDRTAAMRSHAEALVVVGSPGAIRAAKTLVDAHNPDAPVRWMDSPDRGRMPGLLSRPAVWVLLEGPGWADDVVVEASEAGHSVAIAGVGEEDPPPSGWWFHDTTLGDSRRAIYGQGVLTVAAFAGLDIGAFLSGARDMVHLCRVPGLFDNPSYALAVPVATAVRELGFDVVLHLACSARLRAFSAWIAGCWGSMLTGATNVGGIQHPVTLNIRSGLAGDEDLANALLPRREALAIAWDAERDSSSEASFTSRAFLDLWAREVQPVVRVRVPGLDAATLGASVALGLHAGAAAALCLEVDPLGTGGADAWRAAVDRLRSLDAA